MTSSIYTRYLKTHLATDVRLSQNNTQDGEETLKSQRTWKCTVASRCFFNQQITLTLRQSGISLLFVNISDTNERLLPCKGHFQQ